MVMIAGGILCVLSLLLPRMALALPTFEGCVDFRGKPVASILDPFVQDVAMAIYLTRDNPVIVYNPEVVSWLTNPTRLFFYAHECAHHVLGHGVNGHSLASEQQADCWALRELVSRRLLNDDDIGAVQRDIALFGRADWTHLPGPKRAINLRACMGDGPAAPDPKEAIHACYSGCQMNEEYCGAPCPNGAGLGR